MLHIRKNIVANATQVTPQNISKVADWCKGYIQTGGGNPFIRLKETRSTSGHDRSIAEIGDWVIRDKNGFKILTDRSFREKYEAESKVMANKREKIMALIKEVADNPSWDDEADLNEVADKILDLFL